MATKVEYAQANKKPNIFVRFFSAIGNWFVEFGKRFSDGSIGTKLSHFIFGAGNFYHGQILKGIMYLLIQVGIILFMVLCPEVNRTPYGYKAIMGLGLWGDGKTVFNPETYESVISDNDQLKLLFGLVTIAVCIIYVLVWLSNIKSSFKADNDVKKGKKATSFKEDIDDLLDSRFHLLMLTPTMVAALIFSLLPTIFMICIAFTGYNDLDMSTAKTSLFTWNGFDNFVAMFSGSSALGVEIQARFLPVLAWTVVWAILATLTCYFGGILLAILINKKGLKFKKVFRVFFVISIAVPQFISLLAVRELFNEYGPVNDLLYNVLHIVDAPIKFFGVGEGANEYVAKVMVIIVNMWLGVPYTMLMTSGILLNIPADLYEAGTVDGASKTKMFWKITLPYVIFVTTPYLISSFIGNINSFNTIFLLTGGYPEVPGYKAGGTDLLVTWLYKLTIDNGEYNTGAVIGIITFIITATITLIAYTNSKAYKEEDTFQ